MARRPRLVIPGAIYHVMSRGNRKAMIFESDFDRKMFIEVVAETVLRYGVRIFELCEMGNHYHAILDAPRFNLSDAMRHLNGQFAQFSNRQHERTGHVFEERFRSIVVQWRSYLRRASRYVVRNPVRAKVVASPDLWAWSTYRATAGLESPPPWLYQGWLCEAFETDSLEIAQQRYREYVNDPEARDKHPTNTALVWGSRKYAARVKDLLADRLDARATPGWRALGRPPLDQLFVPTQPTRADRDRLIVVAHETHGYTFAAIGKHLRLHPSSVSAAYRRQQDRRPEEAGVPG